MADEVNPGVVPAAGPSATADVDIWSLTPEQATAYLDQKSAQFEAQQTARVPTAEEVESAESAYDAEVRLARLTADETWMRKYAEGSRAERAEYEQLTRMIAAAAAETGLSIRVGDVEVVEEGGISRASLFGVLSDLNKVGIPLEGLERILDGNFSDEDVAWAERELDRGMATKEWTDALLRGDPTVRHEFTALCAVVSAGKAA
jgi:hypothetical protein